MKMWFCLQWGLMDFLLGLDDDTLKILFTWKCYTSVTGKIQSGLINVICIIYCYYR